MDRENSKSISVHIVTVFILSFFALTLVLFVAQCFIQYTLIERRMQHDFGRLQQVYQQRLATARQEGNAPLVRAILLGLYHSHAVGGVLLEPADGGTATAVGRLPEKTREYILLNAPLKRKSSFFLPLNLEAQKREFDLVSFDGAGQPLRLGRVSLYADTSLLMDELLDGLVVAGLYSFVYFLGVSLVLILILRRMVARPLGELADEMKNVTRENPENIVLKAPVQDYSELQTLFASFNFMLLSFISARQALRASAQAIEERNRALGVSEKKYRELFENSVVAMFLFSPQGVIQDANPALATLLGYASVKEFKEQVRNIKTQCFVRPEDFDAITRESRRSKTICYLDARFCRKNGEIFWGTLAVRPFGGGEANGAYFRGSLVDITERLQKQQAEKEKEAARIANKAKGEFLAQMSHEIRTPINGVIGLTRLALHSENPDDQRELLQYALDSSHCLTHLLDEILDFSRIEAGMLELEHAAFGLEEVFTSLSRILGPEVARKRLELVFDFAPGLPLHFVGDQLRLQQVLVNLAGNAVKFTQKGEIVIRSELLKEEEDSIVIEFSVFDTGIGMDEKQQARLFSAFSQADVSISRQYGGSGLGLVICAKLVEKMGGQMHVTSLPGKGSVFSFAAKFGRVAASPGPPECAARLAGKRALVVDDNSSSRSAIVQLLGRLGIKARGCATGAQAVSLLADSSDAYEYLFLDWNMPELEGIERIGLVKELDKEGMEPVIMLPAFGPKLFRQRARKGGIQRLLSKPVTPDSLCACLEEHVQDAPQNGGASGLMQTQTGPAPGRACEVLLVEDNAVNARVAGGMLESLGCRVTYATTGLEAIESVQTMRFDVVFMDIQLPGMDGYEATRAIRAIPRFKKLPIIALTAHAFAEERTKSLAAGMNDHVVKPIEPELLEKILQRWGRENQETPASPKKTAVAGTTAGMAGFSLPGIDMQDVQKRLLGDWSLLTDSFLAFRREFSLFSQNMESALKTGDFKTAAEMAHTLKGAAASISSPGLRTTAQELEDALKKREAFEPIFERLRPQLKELLDALEKFPNAPLNGPEVL